MVTDRLQLRLFTEDDLEDLHGLFSDPDVVRYLYWDVLDMEGARERLADRLARTSLEHEGDVLSLVIEERTSGAFAGEVMMKYESEQHGHIEIGYIVAPTVADRGFATEASRALLRCAFEDLGVHRVTAQLDDRNAPSVRVVEKLGMRREAHYIADEFVKGEWVGGYLYAMLADEFHARVARERRAKVGE